MEATSRAEAERLLAIAENLLEENDLNAARDFALLAQETDPSLHASHRIMAIADVLIAAANHHNNHHWYAILQIDDLHRNNDSDLIKQQYRRLSLLLHPDHNKFPFAGSAFKLVGDAFDVLSDPAKKASYDRKLFDFFKLDKLDLEELRNRKEKEDKKPFEKVDLEKTSNRNSGHKMPERRNSGEAVAENIWTPCPYCYNLFEYPRVYDGYCLRCANCERAFQVVAIPPEYMPPVVPGKEAYYCSPAVFPMSFAVADSRSKQVTCLPAAENTIPVAESGGDFVERPSESEKKVGFPATGGSATRKRGRPTKNPLL